MATAGLSVQVTLLASSVAFSLGAVTNLNSVRWFSAYATLNTVMILILMVSIIVNFSVVFISIFWQPADGSNYISKGLNFIPTLYHPDDHVHRLLCPH